MWAISVRLSCEQIVHSFNIVPHDITCKFQVICVVQWWWNPLEDLWCVLAPSAECQTSYRQGDFGSTKDFCVCRCHYRGVYGGVNKQMEDFWLCNPTFKIIRWTWVRLIHCAWTMGLSMFAHSFIDRHGLDSGKTIMNESKHGVYLQCYKSREESTTWHRWW